MILTDRQIVTVCAGAGFANVPTQYQNAGLTWAVAIVLAESGGDTLATNTIGNSAGTDRGLFQINSVYHSEYSDAVCFDAAGNAGAAFVISSQGQNFGPWSSFHNGQAGAQFARATAAVAAGGEPYLGGSGPAGASTTPTGGTAVDASSVTIGVVYGPWRGGDVKHDPLDGGLQVERSSNATVHQSSDYSLAATYYPSLYDATVDNTTGSKYSTGDAQQYQIANNVANVEVGPHGAAEKYIDAVVQAGYSYFDTLSGTPGYPPDGIVKLYLFQQLYAYVTLQVGYQLDTPLLESSDYTALLAARANGSYIQYEGSTEPVISAFFHIVNASVPLQTDFSVDILDVSNSGQYTLTPGAPPVITSTPAWWGPSLQNSPVFLSIPAANIASGLLIPLSAAVLARLMAVSQNQPLALLWTTNTIRAGAPPALEPLIPNTGAGRQRVGNSIINAEIYVEVKFPKWRLGSIAPNCQTATAPPDTPSSLAISGLEKHQTIFEPHGPVMR